MRKIFVEKIENGEAILTENEHKHLSIVLRAKIGQSIIVNDSLGLSYNCKIEKITKNETILRVLNQIEDNFEPNIDVTLYFGVLKGDANDITVRHAVELGVNQIVPFTSRYTVAQSIKLERLNKIATEASKQCGRDKIPKVKQLINFNQMLEELKSQKTTLFLYEKAQISIYEHLKSLNTYSNVAIIIGAEGGFSQDETQSLINQGIKPVSMGKRILKADTASTVALAILMYQTENLQ